MISIWYLELDLVSSEASSSLLSAEEAARLARFRSGLARAQWLASRCALRRILAGELGCAAGEIRFAAGPYGKPLAVLPGDRPAGLHFSLSRSAGLCAIALSRAGPVGIDIERLAPIAHIEAVAAEFLPAEERDALARLPPGQRIEACLQAWSSLEAYAKAVGDGLQHALPALYRAARRCEGGAARAGLRVTRLSPGPGYVGALASGGGAIRLHRPSMASPFAATPDPLAPEQVAADPGLATAAFRTATRPVRAWARSLQPMASGTTTC